MLYVLYLGRVYISVNLFQGPVSVNDNADSPLKPVLSNTIQPLGLN